MHLSVVAQAAGIGVGAALLGTVIPLRRALGMAPVEAARVGERSANGSGWAAGTRNLRLPGGSFGGMPLRNVLRAPRRTLMTVLGIAAVVAIAFALAGMIDSFNRTVDVSRAEALAGMRQRLTVDLAAPQPAASAAVRTVTGAPSVGVSQPSLRLPVTLRAGGHRNDAFLEVVDPSSPVWHPTMRSGSIATTRPAIALSSRALEDLHLRHGADVEVSYRVPSGRASYRLAAQRARVTATNSAPLRYVAYANRAAADAFGLGGFVKRISVLPSAGATPADVKRALLAIPAVAAVQGAAAGSDAIKQTISQFTDVLVITVVIAMIMALLIAYNSAAINVEERAREHATMFAYGVGVRRVIRGNVPLPAYYALELLAGRPSDYAARASARGRAWVQIEAVLALVLPVVLSGKLKALVLSSALSHGSVGAGVAGVSGAGGAGSLSGATAGGSGSGVVAGPGSLGAGAAASATGSASIAVGGGAVGGAGAAAGSGAVSAAVGSAAPTMVASALGTDAVTGVGALTSSVSVATVARLAAVVAVAVGVGGVTRSALDSSPRPQVSFLAGQPAPPRSPLQPLVSGIVDPVAGAPAPAGASPTGAASAPVPSSNAAPSSAANPAAVSAPSPPGAAGTSPTGTTSAPAASAPGVGSATTTAPSSGNSTTTSASSPTGSGTSTFTTTTASSPTTTSAGSSSGSSASQGTSGASSGASGNGPGGATGQGQPSGGDPGAGATHSNGNGPPITPPGCVNNPAPGCAKKSPRS